MAVPSFEEDLFHSLLYFYLFVNQKQLDETLETIPPELKEIQTQFTLHLEELVKKEIETTNKELKQVDSIKPETTIYGATSLLFSSTQHKNQKKQKRKPGDSFYWLEVYLNYLSNHQPLSNQNASLLLLSLDILLGSPYYYDKHPVHPKHQTVQFQPEFPLNNSAVSTPTTPVAQQQFQTLRRKHDPYRRFTLMQQYMQQQKQDSTVTSLSQTSIPQAQAQTMPVVSSCFVPNDLFPLMLSLFYSVFFSVKNREFVCHFNTGNDLQLKMIQNLVQLRQGEDLKEASNEDLSFLNFNDFGLKILEKFILLATLENDYDTMMSARVMMKWLVK